MSGKASVAASILDRGAISSAIRRAAARQAGAVSTFCRAADMVSAVRHRDPGTRCLERPRKSFDRDNGRDRSRYRDRHRIAGSVVSKSRTGKPATAAGAVRHPQIGQHCPGLNAVEKLLNGDIKDRVPRRGIPLAHHCLRRVRCRVAQHRMAESLSCKRRSNTCGGGKPHAKATQHHRGGMRQKGSR